MSDNKQPTRYKISALSEFSALSAVLIVVMVVGMLLSLAFYIWMAIPPSKVYKLDDDANLFSENEEEELLSLMKSISRKKDINVMVITTEDKGSGYGNSDGDSVRYAQDRFKDLAKFQPFKDNSGVLIMVDMENRFFYIVTYGTAKASITNNECDSIYNRQLSFLQQGEYFTAIRRSLEEVADHNFTSGLLIFTYASFIIGPIGIVALVIKILLRRKRSKITVDHRTYFDAKNSVNVGDEDIFEKETVSVTYHSSGSSGARGGFSGGGFSGGGGGGGGGFGGGGGHF